MSHDLKFLVVCEGPSDFPVIESIIQHVAKNRGANYEVYPLEPQIDATTCKADPHGWTQVKRWCLNFKIKQQSDVMHLPESIRPAALRKNWEALLAISNAQYLLIHLDTDIAEQIDPDFEVSKLSRRDVCQQNLNAWLGITLSKPNCRYILPTYAIETWILSTYDHTSAPTVFANQISDYESIPNVDQKLIQLGYASKATRKGRKLLKSFKRYKNNERYAPRVVKFLAAAKPRCTELANFVGFLENA